MCAPMSAAASFWRSAAIPAPHAPITAPAAPRSPRSRTLKPRWHAALPGSGSRRCRPGRTSRPRASPRKVALIIGNGGYKNVQPLPNPPRDARLIASTFRELGFATVTLAPDLTRDKFFTALHEFGRDAETADWAVVYYAGHGMEIGGVNYLIPTDAMLAADHDAESQDRKSTRLNSSHL